MTIRTGPEGARPAKYNQILSARALAPGHHRADEVLAVVDARQHDTGDMQTDQGERPVDEGDMGFMAPVNRKSMRIDYIARKPPENL